jgi:hypothetical protein
MKNFAWCMLMIAMVAGAFVACKHCIFGGEEEEKKGSPSNESPEEFRPSFILPNGMPDDYRTR